MSAGNKERAAPGSAAHLRTFLTTRFRIGDSVLWRVMGTLRPMRGRIIMANLLLAAGSSLGALALVSLQPLFSTTLDATPATTGVQVGAAEVRETEVDAAAPPPAVPEETAVRPEVGAVRDYVESWEPARRLISRAEAAYDDLLAWMRLSPRRFILINSLLVVLLFILKGVVEFAGEYMMAKVSIRATSGFMRDVYGNVLSQELQFFNETSTGALVNTCYREVFQMGPIVKLLASTRIMLPVNMLILFGALFLINVWLTALLLVLLPLVVLPMMLLTRRIKEELSKELGRESGAMEIMTESFHGIEAVKAFGAEDLERGYFEPSVEEYVESTRRRRAAAALSGPVVDVLNMSVLLVVFLFAILMRPASMVLTQGELLLFLFAVTRFYKPFRTLMTMNIGMQRAAAVSRRIFALLDREPQITDPPDAIPFPEDWRTIRFRNVYMTYRTRRKGEVIRKRALSEVGLEIRRGESVALVGPNGAGKSSLAHLLCHLYEPTEGEILFDEIPLSKIGLASLRRHVCLISQRPVLFDRSVAENIAFGLEGLSEERIREAARKAQADEFITALPGGYKTPVGEQGRMLSGGERQKIALARAFVREPGLLVLDEPATGLDARSVREFLSIIAGLKSDGLTILYITHDRSHLPLFERVLELGEDHRIREVTNREATDHDDPSVPGTHAARAAS